MSKADIVIVDYELGNLFSVLNACEHIGLKARISKDPDALRNADAAILPGVGAFGKAKETMNRLGLDQALQEFITSGKPFMGICLGLQLLFEDSEEFGSSKGLGILPGKIKRIPNEINGVSVKVPQIGWNTIQAASDEQWERSPLRKVAKGSYMYFVHSFYVDAGDGSQILTRTLYEGLEYCSSVLHENIFASQFHPEKSGPSGIQIYRTWAEDQGLLS